MTTQPEKESWESRFEKIREKFMHDIENGREDGMYALDTDLFKSLVISEREAAKRERDEEIKKAVIKIRDIIREQSGSFKYDSCYQDVLDFISNPTKE